MRGTRHNPYIAERVRTLTAEGKSAREIAALAHTTQRTVVKYRERLGISQPHYGDHKMTDEDKAKAEQMFDDGCSATEIARTLGFAPCTIIKHFPGRQWTAKQCGEWSQVVQKAAAS